MMPPPPPRRLFRSSFSFFHIQVFQWSDSSRLNFFRQKKTTFCHSTRSAIQYSQFSILFSFCISVRKAFLVFYYISGLFAWGGVLSLHWKPLWCKIFSVCERKFVYWNFWDAKFLLHSCIFWSSRVLIWTRSCISLDCSCCWSCIVS